MATYPITNTYHLLRRKDHIEALTLRIIYSSISFINCVAQLHLFDHFAFRPSDHITIQTKRMVSKALPLSLAHEELAGSHSAIITERSNDATLKQAC